ncbi:MAG: hypothetical protein ACXVCP_05175 [Bdellovibrio sp.]
MKTLIVILASLANLTAYASTESASDAKVGEIFALKQDVIINDGVKGNYLYQGKKDVILNDNSREQTDLNCSLVRDEDGDSCPGYPKVIVNKGKSRNIKSTGSYNSNSVITIVNYEKKNNCTYTLIFSCSATNYYYFNETFKHLVLQELNAQASKLIDIKQDETEPKPWP